MKIGIMQRDIIWASPQENLRRTTDAISRMEPCDLLVLPEMFATGFGASPQQVAEPAEDGQVLRWMKQVAREHDCAIAGSVAVKVNAAFRNRLYFVMPDGTVAHYDKHHLFAYGGEDVFEAGQERTVVEWRGVRFMLLVCYDLRFPVWNRNREDYDCALYVANWPSARMGAWTALLHARAIENQCFVVGVNRVGSDPNCDYTGDSAVIDAYGRDIATCPSGTECSATADLDMDRLLAFRKKFPVLKDRDI